MLAAAVTSCSDDKNDDPVPGPGSDPGGSTTTELADPEGTVTLLMRNSNSGSTSFQNLYIDKGDNFAGVSIVDVGVKRGLSDVTSIPRVGWTSKAAVLPGHGYVFYDCQTFYRLYVVGYLVGESGGVIGAEVKYHGPFGGADKALIAEDVALTFPADGGSQGITLTNTEIIPFTVSTDRDWLSATPSSTTDRYFLTDAVTLRVDGTRSITADAGTVTLTTLYGKQLKINVSRTGAEPYLSLNGHDTAISPQSLNWTVGFNTNIPLDQIDIQSTEEWLTVEIGNRTSALRAAAASIHFIGEKEVGRGRAFVGDAQSYYASLTATSNAGGERSASVEWKRQGATLATYAVTQYGASLSVTPEVSVSATKGSKQVYINSDLRGVEWTATSSAEWLTAEVEGNQLILDYILNPTGAERVATVTVSHPDGELSATVKVTQDAATLSAQKTATIDALGSETFVTYTTALPPRLLSVNSDAEWLSAEVTEDAKIRITATPNQSAEERTATLTITNETGDLKAEIEVTQSGATLAFASEQITLNNTTLQQTVAFTSPLPNDMLTVSSDAEWLKATLSESDKSIALSFDVNPGLGNREATLTLSTHNGTASTSCRVVQPERRCSWRARGFTDGVQFVSISRAAQNLEGYLIQDEYYTNWYTAAECSADWITLTSTSATLTVRVSANDTGASREARITLTDTPFSILIHQAAYAPGDAYNNEGLRGTVLPWEEKKAEGIIYQVSQELVWSTENVTTGATSKTDGEANCNIIRSIPNYANLYPALGTCDRLLNKDGVTGWYIPALDELWGYKSYLNIKFERDGKGIWSSTESGQSLTKRIFQNYRGDFTTSDALKSSGRQTVFFHRITL